jgi:hypothetical protein
MIFRQMRFCGSPAALAGLVNLNIHALLAALSVAPEWTRRPTVHLMLIYTAIGFAVTLFFRANVDAKGGAYVTGVFVLMTSATAQTGNPADEKGRTHDQ